VLQYREDIVSACTAAEHLEEKLKAEILFLKEQIQAEQCLKENLEDTLQLEIEGCKEEIGEWICVVIEILRLGAIIVYMSKSIGNSSVLIGLIAPAMQSAFTKICGKNGSF